MRAWTVSGLGGGDGDGGELLRVGVDAHGSITEAQQRALAAVPAGDVEDAERGDGVDAIGEADDGLAADDDVAGGAAGAAEGDVDIVDALHHEAAVHGLLSATADALGLERKLGVLLATDGEGLVGLLVGGVDNVDVREVDADLLGNAAQDLAFADDEALGEICLGELAHHFHHLGIVSLEEGDPLLVRRCLGAQLLHQIHELLLSVVCRHNTN